MGLHGYGTQIFYHAQFLLSGVLMASHSNLSAGNLLLSQLPNFSPRTQAMAEVISVIKGQANKGAANLNELGKASEAVLTCFESLNQTLRDANNFFTTETESSTSQSLAFRRIVLSLGVQKGFEKCIKGKWGEYAPQMRAYTEMIGREAAATALNEVRELVTKRNSGILHLVAKMREFDQVLRSKDNIISHLGIEGEPKDVQIAIDSHSKAIHNTIVALQRWMKNSRTVDDMFPKTLELGSFFSDMAGFSEKEVAMPIHGVSDKHLLKNLGPDGMKFFSRISSEFLDTFAEFVRSHDFFPQAEIKGILKTLFHLEEMEKDLPDEIRHDHTRELELLKKKLSSVPQLAEYVLGLGDEGILLNDDVLKLNAYFNDDKIDSEATVESLPSRSLVRQELRRNLETWKTELNQQEILLRIVELKNRSEKSAILNKSEISFFSPRLEKDFEIWKGSLDQMYSDKIDQLLESLARGESVDIKPIASHKKLYELTVGNSGYRIYFIPENHVILAFGNKSSQTQDIETAIDRLSKIEAI